MAKTQQMERPKTHREDPLRDFKEAASQLGLSPDTIARWAHPDHFGRRRIKSVRLPSGRRKIRQSVIDQILSATGKNGDAVEQVEYE